MTVPRGVVKEGSTARTPKNATGLEQFGDAVLQNGEHTSRTLASLQSWRSSFSIGVIPAAVVVVLVTALTTLVAARAWAVPLAGAMRPEVQLTDAWDRSIRLSTYRGMPVLVVYEDKGSSAQNAALKSELAELAKGDKYRRLVALVAVADVTGYDYWPIRGFVRSAIRSESTRQRTVIYCDWDGHVRSALGLEPGASNVVLYARDGSVLYAHAGPMNGAERGAFIDLLRAQVEP